MVKSVFSKNVMLSCDCIFRFVDSVLCTIFFCVVMLIMYLCIVALSLFKQIYGAPRLDNFRVLSASWLGVHATSVCFHVAILYRHK